MALKISFSGVDGVGKSTVIDLLVRRFETKGYNTKRYHFRYRIMPSRNKGLTQPQYGYISGKEMRKESISFLGLLKIVYLWLDFILGSFIDFFLNSKPNSVVLFDRYKYEFLLAPKRIGIWLPHWLMLILFRLIPSCDFNFFLVGDPEVIISRKDEAPKSEIIRQEKLIHKYADADCFVLDVTNLSPEEVVDIVVSHVFQTH